MLLCDEQRTTDVLVVTENGFNNNIGLCKLTNYELATSFCRNSFKGEGLAIFVKTNFTFSPCLIKRSVEKDMEVAGVKLQTNISQN